MGKFGGGLYSLNFERSTQFKEGIASMTEEMTESICAWEGTVTENTESESWALRSS